MAKPPRERYQALVEDYQKSMQQFMDVYRAAKTDEERGKLFQEKYPKPQSDVRRFLEIAESAPQDAAAVDALIWIVLNGRATPEANRAIDRLAASSAEKPKVGDVAPYLRQFRRQAPPSMMPRNGRWATSPRIWSMPTRHRRRRSSAPSWRRTPTAMPRGGLAWPWVRNSNGSPRRSAASRPIRNWPSKWRRSTKNQGLGQEFTALRQKDPDALAKESEALFERAAGEFADVSNGRNTIGKSAQAELNEIRNLGIGKPAPEIRGEDIDGKPFQLSDYKGKVVVVDFWGDW